MTREYSKQDLNLPLTSEPDLFFRVKWNMFMGWYEMQLRRSLVRGPWGWEISRKVASTYVFGIPEANPPESEFRDAAHRLLRTYRGVADARKAAAERKTGRAYRAGNYR